MEKTLKNWLKAIKLSEPTISTILGVLVIVIVGILIFNYFKTEKQVSTNGELLEESESLNQDETGEQIPENLPETYKVEQDDSLWKISEKLFGSGYRWVDLAEANSLINPDYLAVGQEIKIPQVAIRRPETEISKQIAGPSVQIDVQPTDQAISADKYIVQETDNLWEISIRAYGDGYKWTQISQANSLTNPDYLEIGQELILPR